MKTATVRDLRSHFAGIEARLKHGEETVIRKRKRVIAKLVPVRSGAGPARLPDFEAQRGKIFGDQVLPVTGAEIVARDRCGRAAGETLRAGEGGMRHPGWRTGAGARAGRLYE